MNKVLLIGRLVRDPYLQQTTSGINYSRFTIAVNRPFSKEPVADFVPCVAWRNQANFTSNYLKKGALVSIEGRFSSSSYENSEGKMIYVYEVLVENIQGLETLSSQSEKQQDTNEINQTKLVNEEKTKKEEIQKEEKETESTKKEENESDEKNEEVPWELDL